MYQHEFEVDITTKLPNRQSSTSYWGKTTELKKWLRHLSHGFYGNTPQSPLKKVRLVITRISSRQPDKDNLYASCKQLIDALKNLEVITDDAPKYLDLECNWEKGQREQAKTRINIREIE